jgi:Domain of unknown function (DUF4160)
MLIYWPIGGQLFCAQYFNEPKHVHVQREKKICKFWLEPISLSKNGGFSPKELNSIRRIIESNLTKILEAWHEHCG